MHTDFVGSEQCPLVSNIISMGDAGPALCATCASANEQAGENAGINGAVCASQNELRRLSAQILTIQENERHRIATDLHDGIGQSLTLIRLELENCSDMLAANALNDVKKTLLLLRSEIQQTMDELRRVAMDLRPSTLDDLGILATLSWFFREFENACHGTKIEGNFQVQEGSIPAPLKIAIFRILQEAFNNIVKHARADKIHVGLLRDGEALHLTIKDNGLGFDLGKQENYCHLGRGLGLLSMKERAKFSGGTYRIESAVGQGTRIGISWPLDAQA